MLLCAEHGKIHWKDEARSGIVMLGRSLIFDITKSSPEKLKKKN